MPYRRLPVCSQPAMRHRGYKKRRVSALELADALKLQARLEDLIVWMMEKVKQTRKGPKTYTYWMTSWRDGEL